MNPFRVAASIFTFSLPDVPAVDLAVQLHMFKTPLIPETMCQGLEQYVVHRSGGVVAETSLATSAVQALRWEALEKEVEMRQARVGSSGFGADFCA